MSGIVVHAAWSVPLSADRIPGRHAGAITGHFIIGCLVHIEVPIAADIGKREFQKLVMEAVDDITLDEADLLYRVFDTNRDGFVQMTELVRAGDKLAVLSDDHHQWNYYNSERFD